MSGYLGLPKYHLSIIALYLLLLPLLFVFAGSGLKYTFSSSHFTPVILICCASLLILVVTLFLRKPAAKVDLRPSHILFAVLYGAVFAFPEEILFRGVIQSVFQAYFDNTAITILLASAIFGLAHLPNGAKGLHPSKWSWRFSALAFLAGLPLGLLFSITNSLLAPTLLHALFLVCLLLFNNPRLSGVATKDLG